MSPDEIERRRDALQRMRIASGLKSPESLVGEAIDTEVLERTAIRLGLRAAEHASAVALDAVKAALSSDDPQVVWAMSERIGLRVNPSVECRAVPRDALDPNGQPREFSYGDETPGRVVRAVRLRQFGLSPETHIVMIAELLSVGADVRGPWRKLPITIDEILGPESPAG